MLKIINDAKTRNEKNLFCHGWRHLVVTGGRKRDPAGVSSVYFITLLHILSTIYQIGFLSKTQCNDDRMIHLNHVHTTSDVLASSDPFGSIVLEDGDSKGT